ncbi:MAG: VCBS repeat-containing protein [Bryobacterales bacterium]|nr:VCBS repeat-containing protein [Bryobacterales bacterium]
MRRLLLLLFVTGLAAFAREPIFLLHRIGSDLSEGIAVFDFDRDGRLDVTSGAFWYKAPEWSAQEYRECPRSGEYVVNCGEFAIDVNRDGHTDLVAAGWMEDGIFYYENPRQLGVKWPKVKITPSRNTEGMLSADIDGDGNPDILPCHYSHNGVFWVQIKDGKFARRPVGDPGDGHGIGFGDLDRDGRKDILTPDGWYRQVDVTRDAWEWRPEFKLGTAGLAILSYDMNADGLTDIIYSKGHDYGLYWLEQKKSRGKRAWIPHLIDDSYSQIHNLELADLNGDGRPELLAGKRYRGHNEKDPGSFDPLAIFYYTIEPGKNPKIARHPIAYNAIAGAGMQFVIVDLDGDGDTDIVTAGKTGQYWFENLTVNRIPWQERELLFNKYPAR